MTDDAEFGAVRLLEMWAGTQRLELVSGTAPFAAEQPWSTLPTPTQVDGSAGFVEPRTVHVEKIRIEGGPPSTVDPAHTAARLIGGALAPDGTPLDRRTGLLVDFLGSVLADHYCDLLRLDTGGGLHLLRRKWGTTLRLSVLPGPAGGSFARRVDALGAVLSMLLPLSNNADAGFAALVEEHGLEPDPNDLDAADAAVRAWWPTSEGGRDHQDWSGDDPEAPQRLDAEAWADFGTGFEAQTVEWAAGADGQGELAACLLRDLFDRVTTETTQPFLVYGTSLDAVLPYDGDPGAFASVLLVGPHRAGVVEFTFSY